MPWTEADIPPQQDKTIMITGSNTGLGFSAAKVLAGRGARVLLAVRNVEKGDAAARAIRAATPDAVVEVVELDLSNIEGVRRAARDVVARGEKIDTLINNAGVMMPTERTLTDDGHELQWATNHLGHFLLTLELLDALADDARIVTVSSLVAKMRSADIYYDDLTFARKWDRMASYAQSKLANAMFARELHEKLAATGSKITSVAAHPGYSATDLQRHLGVLGAIANKLIAQPVHMGALPILRAATDESIQGGTYTGPKGLGEYRGYPVERELPKPALDATQRSRLWELSADATGADLVAR